eukprot:scaffold5722_cov28-Prasinocladus_malaysianus.AAC.1
MEKDGSASRWYDNLCHLVQSSSSPLLQRIKLLTPTSSVFVMRIVALDQQSSVGMLTAVIMSLALATSAGGLRRHVTRHTSHVFGLSLETKQKGLQGA